MSLKYEPASETQILPASAMEDVDQIVRFVDIHSAPLVWHYNVLRVQGSGCRVQGAGCRVQGSGFRV